MFDGFGHDPYLPICYTWNGETWLNRASTPPFVIAVVIAVAAFRRRKGTGLLPPDHLDSEDRTSTIWRTAMTARLKQSNRATKKRQAAEMVVPVVAPPCEPASAKALAAAALSDKRWEDRRAIRRSQMPATVVSAVKEHKYVVGQVVNFLPGALTLEKSLGLYEIVRHLPPEGPENQYRVKSVGDSHERVVRESQLA
jgi:hypothetical protein